uniref:Uncharacterized protein n=1 Tax=Oryza punctata TaxID=4537 RepID=A0A0E0M2E3_ORYPU
MFSKGATNGWQMKRKKRRAERDRRQALLKERKATIRVLACFSSSYRIAHTALI